MPFRKTYQINNREQGKAAQRDQSYRSCLIALLIFFFMCLILILACKPWKVQNQREDRESYIKHDSQHYSQERTNETTITTISLTMSTTTSTIQKTPTEETVLARTWIIPVDTSTAENRPTEEANVITEDYSKKNVKGSHFERYFENTTSIDEITLSAPVSQKSIEDYTSNEILENVETTKESIGLTTLSHDITIDNVINNATSISSSGPIGVTMKYTSTVDIIKNTSSTTKEFISNSTDGYYNSNKSEVDIVTNNIITSTLLTQSNDTEENVSENSTKKYEKLRIGIDNITFSTTPSLLTDLEESTSAKHSSIKNNYSEILQSETTSNILTRSDSQENEDTRNSTTKDLNYEESAVTEYNAMLINENETRENSPSAINYTSLMDEKFSTKVKSEAEDLMNKTITSINSYTTEKFNVTSNGMEKNESSISNYINTSSTIFYNHTTRTAIPISYNETDLITTGWTTLSNEDTNICETGHCKQIASRMLSYMNHSADPCDDFYEYACGSFEANPQLIDGDLIRRSRNYQRIANQMLKEKRENVRSTFATYYDSCVQYERNMNFSERIIMANDALRKIGKFYVSDTWSDNYAGFTNLFAQLMLHHSALLFDVVPELDEYRRNNFTLKIGPTTYESPFKATYVEDPCFEDTFEAEGQYVDLEILYHNYEKCKNDTSEFMRERSIRKTLTELNVFKGLNDSDLEWSIQSENIENTIHVIESVMQEYFSNFPSKSEVREAYLMNDYSKVSLEDLQRSSTFVNWAQLIHLLTGVHVESNEIIQVYFHAALTKGLRKLEKYAKKNSMNLNNAIMALYANKLYHELVLPKRDNVKDYCLHVATYLLRLEASSLYVSSFTDYEITQMNEIIKKTFNNLKQTLSDKMQEAQWAKEEGRKELLNKINSLKLALPVVSYFKNRNSLYNEYNVSEVILNDNYFNNSMILLKRYRTLMYTELRREVGGPKQIWTYYATPFQSKAQVIYALNLIVIPYGIIDWSLMSDLINGGELSYFLLATLGNLIAHQIAHHFDTNGIHYWNQIRNAQDSLMFENEFTNTHFDDYINCQKENLYQESINMTLPFIDQIVSFRIPRLTLNERLSEIIGLRLAYDTLALTMSNAKRLPWIQLRIDQLFYLAYAQMYCTKTSLTSSYVSLHESENLPSRIRVFVSASNDKFLAKAWNCPLGSQIAPNDVCNVFPYIEIKETSMIPE
ncbi:PREDICTED: membrane metallo-endopeptidase-like 1 [Acromyrmex echinatior]|uniref:Endothelin-converting enzyme 2 n=1 Tax=Acromyrmex echinatior TaxID=103372 RepID=F4X2N4_ACREC|nr:PREDICTED: membrane metallo-endopeptidase-like 1 [Acromyrmex echinatior]EGI59230.1 Endothelin-converting enzyme 2 [Acromyrmex echinatior]